MFYDIGTWKLGFKCCHLEFMKLTPGKLRSITIGETWNGQKFSTQSAQNWQNKSQDYTPILVLYVAIS